MSTLTNPRGPILPIGCGPRIVITGAAGAIGAAAIALLRQRGARVVGIDRTSSSGCLTADVRDEKAMAAVVNEAVAVLGGLDVLINNAGVGAVQDSGCAPTADALATWETNFLGVWNTTAAAVPFLVATRGRVVNVASGLALANVPFAAAYCASKRAVAAYSDVLRLEYRGRLYVTTVYPGYIKTPIHASSERKGASLNGVMREEQVADTAATLARAVFGAPARDLATTAMGAAELWLARHFPGLCDRIVDRRLRRALRRDPQAVSPLLAEYARSNGE